MSGITLDEMIYACHSEARRIEITQDDLIATGVRKTADPGQQRKRQTFIRLSELLELIRADKVMLDRLKAQSNKNNKTKTPTGSDANSSRVADSGDG